MKSDMRLFAPFPIEMDEHPKIMPLSDAAFRALFEATFYSRRMLSDGFLDERVVLKRWGQEVADELSTNDPEKPSWIKVDGGWMIQDFDRRWMRRPAIPPEVRILVFDRDRWACVHCASPAALTIDHIVPWSKGGLHEETNFQTLCRRCNSRKGVHPNA